MGQKQEKMQVPAVWTFETAYKRRFYEVRVDAGETPMVTLYQAIERTHPDGLRDSISARRDPQHTIAVPITAFPSHLARSDVRILVGKNEDDFVRILFLPNEFDREGLPEIKPLRVTMKQILAKLDEAARAVEPNIDRLFQKMFAEASEKRSRKVESEETAMAAGEDE